jgi:ribosomal protein S18 acetylase RimI-like enzyme
MEDEQANTSNEDRRQIEEQGVDALPVDDLKLKDLDNIGWSGSPAHIDAVRTALNRVAGGEVDYLAVRDATGVPISIGGVDYSKNPGTGTLWQLATREDLRGLGIGTRLILALEEKVKARGFDEAVLGVEVENTRAKALYERLGYEVYGRGKDSWEEEDDQGQRSTYHTELYLLKKKL